MIQILEPAGSADAAVLMRALQVDPYGIALMAPKAATRLIRLNGISNITAHILKQEMLSLGGDVALARGVLTASVKRSDCLLIGTLAHYRRLAHKLARQPFGLGALGASITAALERYERRTYSLSARGCRILLGERTRIMGIVNATPDSFSGDGVYARSGVDPYAYACAQIKAGADIIDVGGESSRPGAAPVSCAQERARVIPLIRKLARTTRALISVDTRRAQIAEEALDAGAHIINDITGMADARMIKVAARYRAGVVIMHMQKNPRNMQKAPRYRNVCEEVAEFLFSRVERACAGGIERARIIIDPGIGFGKTLAHNLALLNGLASLRVIGAPIMVGVSRKSFIGALLNNVPAHERLQGTVAACCEAVRAGAQMVRVHDVRAVREALIVQRAIRLAKAEQA